MDRLSEFGCWIVDNFATIADLAFAGAVAFAAIVGIRLNRRLVEETSHLRHAETDPFIAVYIEYQRLRPYLLDLVVQNSGRGPAYDIDFTVEPDIPIWVIERDEENGENGGKKEGPRLTELRIFQNGIKFMAPSQEIRFFFGSASQITREPISIKTTYFDDPTSPNRAKLSDTFLIDASIFDGMSTVGTPPELEVANSLKRIQRDIERIRKGGSWSNMKVTVRRRYFLSGSIDERWSRFEWWIRSQRNHWRHHQHPWQLRWARLRRLVRK